MQYWFCTRIGIHVKSDMDREGTQLALPLIAELFADSGRGKVMAFSHVPTDDSSGYFQSYCHTGGPG